MELSTEAVDNYRARGVLPLGQLLDPEMLQQTRSHVDALREAMDHPGDDSQRTSNRLLNVCSHDQWFHQVCTLPAVLDAAASVLGPNIQYFQDNIFWKPAENGAPTPWHQDNIWWHADPPNILTIWIALDDADPANGGVRYIPGSHTHLIDPAVAVNDPNGSSYKVLGDEQVDGQQAVSFVVPAGHGVMHHCLVIHGAPPNSSQRERRGYTIHLMQAGLLGPETPQRPVLRGSIAAA